MGFNGAVVSVTYQAPFGTILHAGGNTVVGPSIEYIQLGGQNITVDISDNEVHIIYPFGWTFGGGPKPFDGIVVSVVSGNIAPITSVSLIDTNIQGYASISPQFGTQLSFGAHNVFINQLGFSSFPAGSFIKVFVRFR